MQKAKRNDPAVKEGTLRYPWPTNAQPLLTAKPPNTEAPVSYDHNISPEVASIAYTGPVPYVDPPNSTPLAMVTGLLVAL